jgi:monoamine oxidase
MEDVIIIGAGLSGLTTAYYLKHKGINVLLLEGRERTGGRIYTLSAPPNGTPVEMGATWFADKHAYLMSFLNELNLSFFPQYQIGLCVYETSSHEPSQLFTMPGGDPPSYRITGGTTALIERLVKEVGAADILLNTQVCRLCEKEAYIEITDRANNTFSAKQVVVTVPPNLLMQEIEFAPGLPAHLSSVMQQTHTWMSDAIKFALLYKRPFWRDNGFSGTILSRAGMATEVYDHSNLEDTLFALKGFLSPDAALFSKEQREKMVVAQMKKLLGKETYTYLSYVEKLWANESLTHAPYKQVVFPHQNSGHSLYEEPLMNGKLYLSGSETSPYFGGYMDGAVYSGWRAATRILN